MSFSVYKDSIIEKIGGDSQFDYVVMTYCESIRRDPNLKLFFAHLDLNGLMELQKEFLDAAFLDTSCEEAETTIGRLTVKYQMLWKMGMNEIHFEQLKAHFVMALKESWADEDLTQLAENHYQRLLPLFQQSVKFVKNSTSASRPASMRSSFSRNGVNELQRT